MARRKESQTNATQAVQSQPADAEVKVKAEPDPGQNKPQEDEPQGNQEPLQSQLPEEAKAVIEAETGQNQPADEEVKVKTEPDPSPSQPAIDEEKAPLQEKQKYKIICRNPVSKEIGGVTFVNGVGYTDDGFTASWFRNRGYEVSTV